MGKLLFAEKALSDNPRIRGTIIWVISSKHLKCDNPRDRGTNAYPPVLLNALLR
nr:hypothetical protein [Klebsiella oxytoca]URQ56105.1 Hypothetical protein [Raoultella ornithinolytica]